MRLAPVLDLVEQAGMDASQFCQGLLKTLGKGGRVGSNVPDHLLAARCWEWGKVEQLRKGLEEDDIGLRSV